MLIGVYWCYIVISPHEYWFCISKDNWDESESDVENGRMLEYQNKKVYQLKNFC